MSTRKRNVLFRIFIAVMVFAYVGNMAYTVLPHFDFWVIVSFFGLYMVWQIISELWIYQDPNDRVVKDDDKKSYLYLQLSFMLALFFATIDFVDKHYTRNMTLEPAVIYAGFGIFIVSCLIRWWGFRSIGKYFNPRVAIYQNHKLITNGAYQKIRHPLYLGSLLSFIAIPLVFNSWGALLIILLTTIPALIYRVKIEEEFLIRQFGDAYLDYMKNTKRILPGIW